MWTRHELKARGKSAFKANYGNSVIAALILSLLGGGAAASSRFTSSYTNQTSEEGGSLASNLTPEMVAVIAVITLMITAIMMLLKIFVFNPLKVGGYRFFRHNVESPGTSLGVFKEGFDNYGHVVITMFLTDLFLALWTLLFIIPGIVKSYSYRMVPYIIKENPELSANDAITLSRKMMDGNKWNTFILDLSFIGWALLALITLGIVGIFWTSPYVYSTDAALYLKLKENMQ